MNLLADFLLARIAQDETAARDRISFRGDVPVHVDECASVSGPPGPFPCDCQGPERVLADCTAKRALVESMAEPGLLAGMNPSLPTLCDEWLRWLALPYSTHPDFQQEWEL